MVPALENEPEASIHTQFSSFRQAPTESGWVRAMPLASALELVLNQYDIYDIDDLLAILRSSDDARQVADLIDRSRALIDATAGTAHVNVQTEPATATVGTTMESVVNVREVGSMATFSLVTGARMVSAEVQCSPRMVEHAVQATRAARDASTSAKVSTANASTSHYLVIGLGLAHDSTQTELPQPEQPRPEPPEPEPPQPELPPTEHADPQPDPEKPKPEQPQPESGQLQPEVEPEPEWTRPPPVFADCSHYNATRR